MPAGEYRRVSAGDRVLASDQQLPVRPSAELEAIGGRVAAPVSTQHHVHDGHRGVRLDQLDVINRDVVVVPESDVVLVRASSAALELWGELQPRAR